MSSLPVLRHQAATSLIEPASVARSSMTAPEGKGLTAWAVFRSASGRTSPAGVDRLGDRDDWHGNAPFGLRWSDEDDLACAGVEIEGGHAFHPVDERVEVMAIRDGAGPSTGCTPGCPRHRGPWLGAGSRPTSPGPPRPAHRRRSGRPGPPPVPGHGPRRSRGTECVERPVLQEDVDRLAERGGTCGQDRSRLELVVGAGEQDQVQGLVREITSGLPCAGRGGWTGRRSTRS